MDNRLVIPTCFHKQILRALGSAHQGVVGMRARANLSVYWPGMNSNIANFKANCRTCTENAPSQPKEPIIRSPPPQWPFQLICGDYFEVEGHAYLVAVDRFSGWLNLYNFGPGQATASTLVTTFRSLFIAYGAPEEFDSDGGPQLTSSTFQDFLQNWGIKHRLSSVAYPQSNGRAELGVKAAKRIVLENASPSGSLDNDKAARAILQYRNTPLPHLNLSPAQLLLHRHLRDYVPAQPQHYRLHKEWVIAADERELALSRRDHNIQESYNMTSHNLAPLTIGTAVPVQNQRGNYPKRWERTGQIVDILPNRQYNIRMDGSGRITLRNRRFLKPTITQALPNPYPSAETKPNAINHKQPVTHPTPIMSQPSIAEPQPNIEIPQPDIPEDIDQLVNPPRRHKLPLALRRLTNYNKPGVGEM